mgnify:FL=1
MIKIIVDGFGGDNSPQVNVEGSVLALNEKKDLEVIITGDEDKIKEELKKYTYDENRLKIIDAKEVVSCNEKPTEAIRNRKESSLVKALIHLHDNDDVHGLVSVGSTGAVLVGAVLRIGRIKGVQRPAFCPILPTMNGGIVGICDSGANVDCDPINLKQFAIMGSLYLEKAYGIKKPRVALLNIGTEEEKGNKLSKEAYQLLKETEQINFVGNMESRDLLSGNYDLVVCDGFDGNVLIKSTEGACLEMLKLVKKTINSSFKNKFGGLLLKKSLYDIKDMMDYNNYGGGVMLGTKKIIVKGHGSSKTKAIKNCILQAYEMEKNNLCSVISDEIAKMTEE